MASVGPIEISFHTSLHDLQEPQKSDLKARWEHTCDACVLIAQTDRCDIYECRMEGGYGVVFRWGETSKNVHHVDKESFFAAHRALTPVVSYNPPKITDAEKAAIIKSLEEDWRGAVSDNKPIILDGLIEYQPVDLGRRPITFRNFDADGKHVIYSGPPINLTMDKHAAQMGLGHWRCMSARDNGEWERVDGLRCKIGFWHADGYPHELREADRLNPIRKSMPFTCLICRVHYADDSEQAGAVGRKPICRACVKNSADAAAKTLSEEPGGVEMVPIVFDEVVVETPVVVPPVQSGMKSPIQALMESCAPGMLQMCGECARPKHDCICGG